MATKITTVTLFTTIYKNKLECVELHQIHLFKTWKLKLVLFLGGSFIAAFISFRLTKASSKYLQSDLIVVQSLLFIMDIKISSNNPDRFSSINFLRNSSRMLSYAGHSSYAFCLTGRIRTSCANHPIGYTSDCKRG